MKDSARPFFIVQIIGWTTFLVMNIAIRTVLDKFDIEVVWASAIAMLFCFLYSTCFGYLVDKYGWKALSPGKLLWRGFIAGPIFAFITVISYIPLQGIISGDLREYGRVTYLGNMINMSLIMYVWMLCYFAYNYFKRYRASEVSRWKLEAAVKEAELKNLKLQINPHFMFNALNNIRALILENPQNARQMLTSLSDIMRYSLNHNKLTLVPLSSELEIVESYFELISIQYEEKLIKSIEVDPALLQTKIPPMMIQLLVENAIKHGISQLPQGGEVKVNVFKEGKQVMVEVRNSGQLNTNVLREEKTGIGLQNLKDRLEMLYESNSSFDLSQVGSQVVATIKFLPLSTP